jgi:hypothetical protein
MKVAKAGLYCSESSVRAFRLEFRGRFGVKAFGGEVRELRAEMLVANEVMNGV